MERGTKTYVRTGAASPNNEKTSYSLGMTYVLDSGNKCTAYFNSRRFSLAGAAKAVM